jgi:hypothetical protein
MASITNLNKLDVLLVPAEFFTGGSFFGFRLGLFNQAVRGPLEFIAKRPHNFVTRLFAFVFAIVAP